MKAAMLDRYGPPDVVEVCDIERPIATGDQVLVRVHAASVNRADLDGMYPRWKFIRLFLGLRRPRNPRLGIDVAGVVEAVGPGVTTFKPGDQVFGDIYNYGAGAFAEYVCVPQKALAAIPAGMTFDVAATLPHSAILALQGLRTRRGRTAGPGHRVLIVGASGNVGPFAVQIAKSRGAHVTGVARTEKLDFVRSLGADEVIDYTKVDPAADGQRYDWIVDVDAHHAVPHWRKALNPRGVYAAMGGSGSWLLSTLIVGPVVSLLARKQMGLMLWWKPFNQDDVDTLTEMIASGKLKPIIDRRIPLGEVVEGLRHVDQGRARGKLVIEP